MPGCLTLALERWELMSVAMVPPRRPVTPAELVAHAIGRQTARPLRYATAAEAARSGRELLEGNPQIENVAVVQSRDEPHDLPFALANPNQLGDHADMVQLVERR